MIGSEMTYRSDCRFYDWRVHTKICCLHLYNLIDALKHYVYITTFLLRLIQHSFACLFVLPVIYRTNLIKRLEKVSEVFFILNALC